MRYGVTADRSSCIMKSFKGCLFSSLNRAIEQDTEVIRTTICTRVSFFLKFFTIPKLFYTH